MSKIKQLNFEGKNIYVGLDVHKKNWKLSSRMEELHLRAFSQDPDPEKLIRYFKKNYPGAKLKVAYEAGFCGFGIQRSLSSMGIECLVVNAADVPSSDKERKRKNDKRDAAKLCRELFDGSLEGIYIPSVQMEQARTLVRQRYRLMKDQTRCKNRIKHLVNFSGISLGLKKENWNTKHITALEQVCCQTEALRKALDLAVAEYKQIRALLKQATLAIRQMAREPMFAEVQKYLRSIPGIGLINGMVIQTEIQDIKRFRILDGLCSYAGFVPDISTSDEHTAIKGITSRCNEFLREAIIESSWMCIRNDPAMLLKYNQYLSRMKSNKAIIRIGKHLLNRIRYVWKNQVEYQNGIMA